AIFRRDQEEIRRHLAGWEFEKVVQTPTGHRPERWRKGEVLDLPTHEIRARTSTGGVPELEILLNETHGGRWTFPRDPRIIPPVDEAGIVVAGVPVLAPEIVLLYKAKAPRPRDEKDFRNALARLKPSRRRWLRDALETT